MAKVKVLCLPGTSETHEGDTSTVASGMLKNITDQLDPAIFEIVWFPYDASYGYPETYGDSRDQAVEAVFEYVLARPGDEFVLLGYSQGAVIVGDVSNLLLNTGAKVLGVCAVADGIRHAGQGRKTPGYGIAGQRWIYDTKWPVWQIVADGDPICNLPKNNPLRPLAGITEYMSKDLRRWFLDLQRKLTVGGIQPWNFLDMQSWIMGAAYLRGYLWDKRHTDHYVWDGHCDEAAALIKTVRM